MVTTEFVWDELDDNVEFEVDGNDSVVATYLNRPGIFGEPLSQTSNGATSYFNYDAESCTRSLADENENVTDTFTYSGYGDKVARSGVTATPFQYKGKVGYQTNTETDDVYVRARTYSPESGRWLSKDPLGFIDGPSLYRAYFAPGNVDPEGTDIYILHRGVAHLDVCVDIWTVCNKNKAYVTKRCFSFALSIQEVGGEGCCFPGIVYEADYEEPTQKKKMQKKNFIKQKKTTCQEDKKFLKDILNHVGHYQPYNYFTRNCRHFSHHWFDEAPGKEVDDISPIDDSVNPKLPKKNGSGVVQTGK